MSAQTVNYAILGAGIFARTEHLPAILSDPNASLLAIYSRSAKTATSLPQDPTLPTPLPPTVSLYADHNPAADPAIAGNLDALLARKDIHAVVVALPILAQPDVIRRALLAGKHVLSEKPIAPTLAEASALIDWYVRTFPRRLPVWGVAENFRFQEAWGYAREQAGALGGVTSFDVRVHNLVVPGGKYFETEWRKVPGYQGGFLLDGGVHFVAALRELVSGTGAWRVVALTQLQREWLPPVDTLRGVVHTEAGVGGTFVVSFGSASHRGGEWVLECKEGVVKASPGEVVVTPKEGEPVVRKFTEDTNGVGREVRRFTEVVREGKEGGGDERQRPEEAWGDLEALEMLLKSGEEGGVAKVVGFWKGE